MRKIAILAAAPVIALAGCGSATVTHRSVTHQTAAQRHGAHTICSLFVASTKLATDLGDTSGSAEQQMLNKVLYGKIKIKVAPRVLQDAEALVAAPTSATVQRLQQDCAAVGVYQPVWASGG
jgi:hypothetical protein